MVGQRTLRLAAFLLSGFLLSEAAQILTISSLGGSHSLLMDQVSHLLQDHGHNVTITNHSGHPWIPLNDISYNVINWLSPEGHRKEFKEYFDFFMREALRALTYVPSLSGLIWWNVAQVTGLLGLDSLSPSFN
uniref:UDP-glucuronosyltransferase 3A1-like n=1 Tax=Ursus maritimus TaxID=29073 RepID=A0A452U6U4_URSMA